VKEHPAQAAVNAIMSGEDSPPDLRPALYAGHVVVAEGGRLTVDRYPRFELLCGCFRDGSFACEEHRRRDPE